MNRLSPLIVRKAGPHAAAAPYRSIFADVPAPSARNLDDLKLFATGWAGGLVFFGTLLG